MKMPLFLISYLEVGSRTVNEVTSVLLCDLLPWEMRNQAPNLYALQRSLSDGMHVSLTCTCVTLRYEGGNVVTPSLSSMAGSRMCTVGAERL